MEHLRETTLVGSPADSRAAMRSGSLLVLCAWAGFVVAGSAFAKFSEHWEAAMPSGSQAVPSVAYNVVQGAAFVGGFIVALAAAMAVPSFIRLIRAGRFDQVRSPVRLAVGAALATSLATAGLVRWAHHLGFEQRNGALWPYTALGGLWAAGVVVSIGLCTGAVVVTVGRLGLSNGLCRAYRVLAIALTLVMVTVSAGLVVWWVSVAGAAPRFFDAGLFWVPGGSVSPAMVGSGLLMLASLGVALVGTRRTLWADDLQGDHT